MRLYKQNKLLDLTTIHQIKLNLIASEVVFFPFGFIEQSTIMWVEMIDPEKNHLTIRKQN